MGIIKEWKGPMAEKRNGPTGKEGWEGFSAEKDRTNRRAKIQYQPPVDRPLPLPSSTVLLPNPDNQLRRTRVHGGDA